MSEEQAKAAHQPEAIPAHVQARLEAFNAIQDRTPVVEPTPITVTLLPLNSTSFDGEGEAIQATAGVTTPRDILLEKCKTCGAVAAYIDGTAWDLTRPIVASCKMCFVNFDDARGKEVFWHSSAHILGASIELELGVEIAIGPATENGFFYDFEPHTERITNETLAKIQKRCDQMSKRKVDYERKMVTREEALQIFTSNKFKTEILTKRVEPNSLVSLYRTGTFIDLCRGPHIPNAQCIKAWWVIDVSGCLWNGQADKRLNRIRAVTYPDQKLMKEYKHFLEEAAKRDHRKLGVDHELFFFHPWSPGCAFFYPDGAHIYNKLIDMIREQYHKRGFVEVITPNIFYDDLFKTSGHWQHYRDDMFHFPADEAEQGELPEGTSCAELCRREIGMKPMNCPGHCLVFRSRERSYRELPIRMAEFGVLHRNEATGALSGLTRVRRFVQDDCHVFCRRDQIRTEITSNLDFMKEVYDIFGMSLEFTLSTINMEKYMGDLAVWEDATEMLRQALTDGGFEFKVAPNEAAFYGPKIDCLVKDCLGRKHQLATIQLDFQLPEKFDLNYVDKDHNKQRPVMVHRAILGSLERFIGVAVEHFMGRFPFWMSPHQITIIPASSPIKPEHLEYAEKIWKLLHDEHFTVSIDDSSFKLPKKVLRAQSVSLSHAILVVGDKEIADNSVAVRWWNSGKENATTTMPFDEFLNHIKDLRANYK